MKRDSLWMLHGATVLIMLIVFGCIWWKARRSKHVQDALMDEARGTDGTRHWERVYASRPGHFKRRMKLLGFEARGVLGFGPQDIRLLARLPDGTPLRLTYPRDRAAARWIGNPGLGNSNLHWMSLGEGGEQIMLSADTGFNAVQSREASADLYAQIVPPGQVPQSARRDFALESNPASLTVVVLFFALLAFAAIDGAVLNTPELVGMAPVLWAAPGALLVAVPAYPLLVRKQVPSRESLMLSIALLVAMVPLLKRVDQLLAGGKRSYEYPLTEAAVLEPVEPGPRTLQMRRAREFWASSTSAPATASSGCTGRSGCGSCRRRNSSAGTASSMEPARGKTPMNSSAVDPVGSPLIFMTGHRRAPRMFVAYHVSVLPISILFASTSLTSVSK